MRRLMFLFSRLPLAWLQAVGALLGWTAWAASPPYRRRLKDNATLAGVSALECRASVAEAGRLVAELPWLWLAPRVDRIDGFVQWQGAELIEQALAEQRGLVLLTPHMGSFEVCAQAYARRFGSRSPMTALYRPARKAWLRELEETARDRPGLETAPANLAGVRQMIRALRQGKTVGLLPDQVPPDGLGVWAPFFGRPAYTMTLAARLVQQTGAAWLLMWARRLPAGQGWVLEVSRPAEPLPSANGVDADALALAGAGVVNREMERLIHQCPSQYLWGYHRYKSPRGGGPGAAP
jgi:Kdo2-lipid IVA lauroyltransferase/acyltransferase